ncbi:MAG: PoNe immunity protein domain-containing protein [Pseudomonas sp.]
MNFQGKRRQQFLNEQYYLRVASEIPEILTMFKASPAGSGSTIEEGWMISKRRIAANLFDQLLLEYTGGESISSLRNLLEEVVIAYEQYAELLWKLENDPDEPIFTFVSLDDYSSLMQLMGLCFLLHRRDLLPRIAALQDGIDEENGGTDTLYEEFMAHAMGPNARYESDYLCCSKPYQSLFHALTEQTPEARLQELHTYLKRWYKDLSGCGWHDSHKLDANGDPGGYYGYWSFEAGAAVILLGIEDDSSLHKYLYYPKDLVAWSREHAADYPNGGAIITPRQPSVEGGNPCPKAGWWFTPAKADSLRYFEYGEIMPNFENSEWGSTHWQLGSRNMEP